jgi:hypothetical protein
MVGLMRRFEIAVKCRQTGFSYLWVLMLVAFMGVSLTLAVEIDSTASQRDKEKELLDIGRQFRTAIGRYYETQLAAGRHEYPTSLVDLLQDQRVPGIKRHLRKIFVDPMTGKAEWGLVKIGERVVGVHSLSDKLPIKQDGFEVEDLNLRGKQKVSEWVFTYPADLMLQIEAGRTPNTGPSAGEISRNSATQDLVKP